jgi:hypothetical protein
MQTYKSSLKLALCAAVFLRGVLLNQSASAAVGSSVTPAAISNQYTGYITIQVSNLTAGAAVVVQKFIDVNSNGIVDAGDALVQQFQVSDGQGPALFSGVTNVNIPFDSNPASGAITTQLSPATEGVVQRFVAQYLFVISSPTGQFTPMTNTFIVTNSAYGQKFTGTVTSGGSNVPNALVFLARPPGGGGGGGGGGFNPLGGVVADSSGNFKIKASAGTYRLVAFGGNFVGNSGVAPVLTLGNGTTINTNLVMTAATRTISGRVVDAGNNNLGLPGILFAAQSNSKDLGLGATDTNGNFVLPALAEQFGFGSDQQSLDLQGYLGLNNSPTNVDATASNVTGVTIALTKATAMIYGSVLDQNNNPLAGVRMGGQNETNSNGPYQGDGTTDPNGNYSIGVDADLWSPEISSGENSISFGNYIFSQGPAWVFNNGGPGTNVSAGAAIQANFGAILATNQITGNVKDNNNNPIVSVQVFASATINGNSYQSEQNTDSNGNYSLNVANGSWNVGVYCCCDNNSLQSIGSYQCPNGTNVNISNNNGVANFIVQTNSGGGSYLIDGYVTDTLSNPVVGVNVYATNSMGSNLATSTGANGYYQFTVGNGNWDVSVLCCCGSNSLQNLGNYQCPSGTNVNISNNGAVANFIVQTNSGGGSYLIDGYVMDTLSIPVGGVHVHANNGLGSNLTTSTDTNGYYQFSVGNGNWDVVVDCADLNTKGYGCVSDQQINISGGNYNNLDFTVSACGALAITTTSLPDGMVGSNYFAQLQNDGCSSPFTWTLTPGSLPLPAGLGISTNGGIGGIPTSAPFGGVTNYFSVRVTDSTANYVDQLLSIAVYPTLTIALNSLPNGTNGKPYSAQVLVTGGNEYYIGNTPDGYSLIYNGPVPPGLSIGYGTTTVSNQYLVISGTPTNTGTFSFTMGAQDADNNQVQRNVSITIIASSLQITSTSPLVPATVGVNYMNQLQGTGGTPPYNWTIALGSQPLPPNLSLSTNGVISGMPATAATNNFIVRITDHNAVTTTKAFTLVVNPAAARPTISSPLRLSNHQFQFTVNGEAARNYTVQYALGLTGPGSWSTLVVTNPGVSSFTVTDPNATNGLRFYRVMVGP